MTFNILKRALSCFPVRGNSPSAAQPATARASITGEETTGTTGPLARAKGYLAWRKSGPTRPHQNEAGKVAVGAQPSGNNATRTPEGVGEANSPRSSMSSFGSLSSHESPRPATPGSASGLQTTAESQPPESSIPNPMAPDLSSGSSGTGTPASNDRDNFEHISSPQSSDGTASPTISTIGSRRSSSDAPSTASSEPEPTRLNIWDPAWVPPSSDANPRSNLGKLTDKLAKMISTGFSDDSNPADDLRTMTQTTEADPSGLPAIPEESGSDQSTLASTSGRETDDTASRAMPIPTSHERPASDDANSPTLPERHSRDTSPTEREAALTQIRQRADEALAGARHVEETIITSLNTAPEPEAEIRPAAAATPTTSQLPQPDTSDFPGFDVHGSWDTLLYAGQQIPTGENRADPAEFENTSHSSGASSFAFAPAPEVPSTSLAGTSQPIAFGSSSGSVMPAAIARSSSVASSNPSEITARSLSSESQEILEIYQQMQIELDAKQRDITGLLNSAIQGKFGIHTKKSVPYFCEKLTDLSNEIRSFDPQANPLTESGREKSYTTFMALGGKHHVLKNEIEARIPADFAVKKWRKSPEWIEENNRARLAYLVQFAGFKAQEYAKNRSTWKKAMSSLRNTPIVGQVHEIQNLGDQLAIGNDEASTGDHAGQRKHEFAVSSAMFQDLLQELDKNPSHLKKLIKNPGKALQQFRDLNDMRLTNWQPGKTRQSTSGRVPAMSPQSATGQSRSNRPLTLRQVLAERKPTRDFTEPHQQQSLS